MEKTIILISGKRFRTASISSSPELSGFVVICFKGQILVIDTVDDLELLF
jgi:hypothetical protein